jgi:hypothetical protein
MASTLGNPLARTTSDLVHVLQSSTLFIFKFLNMFIYTNSYSIT